MLVDKMPQCEGQGQLFDPTSISPGRFMLGLPHHVLAKATHAARFRLFSMPRHSRDIGPPEDMRDIEFWPTRNSWHESIGAIGITLTAEHIAMLGARQYMSDILGVDYFRFEEELKSVALSVVGEYEAYYPTAGKASINRGQNG